jgi:isopenicillin-N N-acyltransferase like protein
MSVLQFSRRAFLSTTLAAALGPRLLADQVPACPIPLHTFSGGPEELGSAYARALGPTIRVLLKDYLKKFLQPQAYDLALSAGKLFEKFFPADYWKELVAVAKEAGLPQDEMLLGNVFLDLVPIAMCSTITVSPQASQDNLPRMGRNLDFPGLGVAEKQSVVVFYKPKGRNAFASVTWPGLLGVLSGMNEHGLCVANMEVPRRLHPASGVPCMYLYRLLLERCKTVDEAIDLLKQSQRNTANNLMLIDAQGTRAVAEIRPDDVAVRRAPADKPLISTNHQRGADLATPGRCRRYDALARLSTAQWGKIDVPAIERMLNAASASLTIQSMVFEPTTRKLFLSAGPKAATGPFYEIDVRKELQ